MTRAPSTRRASAKKLAPAQKRRAKTAPAPTEAARPAPVVGVPTPVPPRAEREATFRGAWEPQLSALKAQPLTTLNGVTVWLAMPRLGKPCWMLLTTGLWEHGVELSLRVPRQKDEVSPPSWATKLVGMLIEATTEGQVAGVHQSLSLTRVLEGAPELTGCAFAPDPLLTAIEAPFVSVTPLLTLGLMTDEERLVREWNPASLVDVLGKMDPALLTDPDRASMLQSPRARAQIELRVAQEGSSMQVMRAALSKVSGSTWTLSVEAVPTLIGLMKGRLAHQRPFSVQGPTTLVHVLPADVPAFSGGAEPTLTLSQTGARQLRAQLRARPGRYQFEALPGFTLEVV
jgi:suppressor of fused-like protein